jgi:ribosomal protein L11 methyltransferase
MKYFEFQFDIVPFNPWSEIVSAYLSDIRFDGFSYDDETLKAFIAEGAFNSEEFNTVIERVRNANVAISYSLNEIPQQNWNRQWESNFDPVPVNDELLIIAPFHQKDDSFKWNVVIQPKMSFGTGHHQTTHLMCEAILKLDFKKYNVLDMGSGTGILAILAEKKGGKKITAIDIEEWSVESCIENSELNNCRYVESLCGGIELIDGKKFDVIFANINKNILKAQMNAYYTSLNENGFLYLSGFFETDIDELTTFAKREGFYGRSSSVKEEWAMLIFQK